ncbi:MAG TPA: hypothetical protein VGG89_06355 [Candidatus Baltobacteraceae bacterium]
MPFLAVVHLRELVCQECGTKIADPGARSFVVDPTGEPIGFDAEHMPEEMTLTVACPGGHVATLLVPNEVAVEETMAIPDSAPIAADVVLSEI